MGVYRNYSSQMNYRKIRITRVALEILISGLILINSIYHAGLDSNMDATRLCRLFKFHFLNFLSSCTIMICGILNSRSYLIFIKNLVTVQQYFDSEGTKKYTRELKNFFIIITAVLCFCGVGVLPVRIFFRIFVRKLRFTSSLIMLLTSEIFSELRFSMEHVIFYIYIRMVHCLLKSLNDYVSNIQDYYNEQETKICIARREVNNPLTEERMEEWATNYMLLVGCSKALSACFSFQVNV